MKYHFVYKTTNIINQKFYIGVHSTNDLNDGYLGSGVILRKAVLKYRKENFTREILEFTDSRHSAFMLEKSLVDKGLLNSTFCYNQALGGYGGNLGS